MIRVALRSVVAHAKQFLLTALAVVLGVAFLSGTLALRGVLSDTFSELVSSTNNGDLYLEGEPLEGTEGTASFATESIDSSLTEEVLAVDGVESANPYQMFFATLVGADDAPVTSGGAPTYLYPIYDDAPGLSWVQGGMPAGESEIALESDALARSGLEIGDSTHLVVAGQTMEVTVVGEFSYGTSMAGATLVAMEGEWLLDTYAADGQVSVVEIQTVSKDTDDIAQVADALREVLPAGVRVLTRDEVNEESSAYIESILGFIQTFLMVFVVLAMFVGSFIIMNTFAMSVRQRQKEFALLRAIGASPASVFGIVLLQAVVIGLVGAAIGIAAGAGLLLGMVKLLEAAGMPLLDGVPMTTSVIVSSLIVGLLVTVVGALLPARDAALTAPIEAMRDVSGAREKSLALRGVLGALLCAVGIALALAAWTQTELDHRTWILGGGAAALLLGVLVFAPLLARPVVAVLGLPFRVLRPAGRLAIRNIAHNPRRTANTSGALMVGMALVCGGATLAASVNTSVEDIINDSMNADFMVQADASVFYATIPADLVTEIAQLDGVEEISPLGSYTVSAELSDGTMEASTGLNIIDPETMNRAYNLNVVEGDLLSLDETQIAVSADSDLAVGDTVSFTGPLGQAEATVTAIVDPQGIYGSYYVAPELAAKVGSFQGTNPSDADEVLAAPTALFVTLEDDADSAALQAEIVDILAPTYVYQVMTADEISDQAGQSVNQILAILYALLGLSIAIAILGIVNTLVLSVTERTREIGLMRAVGLGRSQLGGEIIVESVLTALFGTLVGGAVGVFLAAALQRVLEGDGLEVLTIPWGQVVGMLVLSVIVGVLAALWPALRASRVPILEAIATE